MFRRLSRWAVAAPVALVIAGLSGCGSGEPATSSASTSAAAAAKEVNVFAAASLTETFTELGRTFESAHPGTTVKFNFGSSATLAQQIVQGLRPTCSPRPVRPR